MIRIANTFRAGTIFILGMAVVACSSTSSALAQASVESELMDADRAYAAYNVEHGYKAASSKFIDFEKGFMIEAGRGFLEGETDIMSERQLDVTPSPVHWEPIGAMAGDSADLGMTWGTFIVEGTPETTGNYVTVWRKVEDEWKIVTDVAVDDPMEE